LKEREVSVRMRREEEKAAAKLRSEARRMIRSVTRSPDHKDEAAPDLAPGSRVVVDGMGMSGTVESAQGDRVVISVRGKRVTVARQDCIPESRSGKGAGAPGPRLPEGVTFERYPAPFAEEIHLRGLTVEEALERVDKFLDDAYLASLSQVRLIHGIGSGRLKQAVGEMLARHPHVDNFAGAPSDKGGAGVTIVTLRL
jgi:DNA mismatch repair protein MutS2